MLTICPLPGGRLVAHGQSVYPCHEDGIQFDPYLTTALDEVGCDVSLSWVGLGWVMSVLLIQNIPRRKTRTRHLLKLRMLHFGTRVWTICPLPGGRLVAHGQSVYPCHEDGIQFGPYLTTALDEVGCDVSLSWVGLGWVLLWLGWVRWCGGRRCR